MSSPVPADSTPSAPRSSGAGGGDRWYVTLAGIALLVLIGGRVWWDFLATSGVLVDEEAYVGAVDAMAGGGSPYDTRLFVYNPPFAVFLEGMSRWFGILGALRILRFASLLGLAALVWISLRRVRWPAWLCVALGAWVMALSPMVVSAMIHGSVNGLFAGLVVVSLAGVATAPILCGVLLGVAVGAKPLALPAIAVLTAAPRPRLRRAGIVAGTTVGLSQLFGLRYLPDLLTKAGGLPEVHYNISLHRVLHCFGLDVSVLLLIGGTTLLAAYLAYRFAVDDEGCLLLGCAFSLLSIPSGSPYTYLLALPVATLGIEQYRVRSRPRGLTTGLLVALAVIAVHSTYGLGKMPEAPLIYQGLIGSVPVLATPLLAVWVLRERARHLSQ